MNRLIFLLFVSFFLGFTISSEPEWGFFAHKRINRAAVFCLPEQMLSLFKQNIDYISEQSVSPDRRRYSMLGEAERHYIDIDHWGRPPYDNIPRNHVEAVAKFSSLSYIDEGDTISLFRWRGNRFSPDKSVLMNGCNRLDYSGYEELIRNRIFVDYGTREWTLPRDTIIRLLAPCSTSDLSSIDGFILTDEFSKYGILPFHLNSQLRRLTDAFYEKDEAKALWIAAELGHYIGDAHVPLHTTVNYDGQLTNQKGLHAFWESRIPELLADEQFDLFAGKAEYIENPTTYFWDLILSTHALLDDVLRIEKELAINFPKDQQYCYEDRNDRTVRTQCEAFTRAYHSAMDGMVEDQMKKAINVVASCWYTAWVNAGQPPFSTDKDLTVSADRLTPLEETGRPVDPDTKVKRAHKN